MSPECRDSGFRSALRNCPQNGNGSHVAFLCIEVGGYRSRIARTGLTPGGVGRSGRKLEMIDDRLRAMQAETLSVARRKFSGRTDVAILVRGLKAGVSE
jgi:hypothetical protein